MRAKVQIEEFCWQLSELGTENRETKAYTMMMYRFLPSLERHNHDGISKYQSEQSLVQGTTPCIRQRLLHLMTSARTPSHSCRYASQDGCLRCDNVMTLALKRLSFPPVQVLTLPARPRQEQNVQCLFALHLHTSIPHEENAGAQQMVET